MKNNIFERLIDFPHQIQQFKKGECIFHADSVIRKLGLIIKGSVQIERNDFWGNRTIMDKISAGGFFGETYAITGEALMIDVFAVEDSEIAFIDVCNILNKDSSDSADSISLEQKLEFTRLILLISSNKNLKLSQKIMFTSPKTIRERLTIFLTYHSKINNSNEFEIPFDRQSLADYLNIERTAMSKELGKMQKDGLLETRKNKFKLIKEN